MYGDALKGQAALVTGASSGMGRAIAVALAEAGAGAVLVARSEGRLRVNGAGVNVSSRLLGQVSLEDWRRLVDVNLNALFYFIRAALPALLVRGGSVVNILSFGAREPAPWSGAAYAAAKSGGLALTRLLNAEERHRGIRACALLPGDTDTPLMDTRPIPPTLEARAGMLKPADLAAAVLYAITAPPHVNVEEIALRPQRLQTTAPQFQRL